MTFAGARESTERQITICPFLGIEDDSMLVDCLVVIPLDQTDVHSLPAFVALTVTADVTIETLAQQLSIDPVLLEQYNDLNAGDILIPGEWVLIPHTRAATPRSF